jgi:hypothetical protein
MPSSLSGHSHPARHESKPDLTVRFVVPDRGKSPSTVASHSGRSRVSYIDCTRTAGQSHESNGCHDNNVGSGLLFTQSTSGVTRVHHRTRDVPRRAQHDSHMYYTIDFLLSW